MTREFLDFLKKFGVIGLAVAVVIGGAVQKLITAIVNDLVMPVVGAILPSGDWRAAALTLGPVKLLVGDMFGALIDFLIVALVIFSLTKLLIREKAADKK